MSEREREGEREREKEKEKEKERGNVRERGNVIERDTTEKTATAINSRFRKFVNNRNSRVVSCVPMTCNWALL